MFNSKLLVYQRVLWRWCPLRTPTDRWEVGCEVEISVFPGALDKNCSSITLNDVFPKIRTQNSAKNRNHNPDLHRSKHCIYVASIPFVSWLSTKDFLLTFQSSLMEPLFGEIPQVCLKLPRLKFIISSSLFLYNFGVYHLVICYIAMENRWKIAYL
jgi:hypothetical protein